MNSLLRKSTIAVLAAAAFATAPSAASAASCADADLPVSAATAERVRDAILCLTNAEREGRGLAPLADDAKLRSAAQKHTDDMAARGYFSHEGADGRGPSQRVTAAGYDWSYVSENIARGYDTAAKIMSGWMSSDGHRRNILSTSARDIGIGVSPEALYTQVFGARRSGGGSTSTGTPSTDNGSDGSLPVVQTGGRISKRGGYIVFDGVTSLKRAGIAITAKVTRAGRTYKSTGKTDARGRFALKVKLAGTSGKPRWSIKVHGKAGEYKGTKVSGTSCKG